MDIFNEGNFGTFKSSDECIEYLVSNEYLIKEKELSLEEISKKYVAKDLKEILRENNLKISGSKQELVESVYPILNEDSVDYVLTDKAKKFLKENEWIDLYMFALVSFKFADYETYVENSNDDMINTAFKFCDEILSYSFINNSFIVFIDALSAKAHVYAYIGDYESFLDYTLQRFILSLNPFDIKSINNYQMIGDADVINLVNVTEKLNMGSLKKRFDKIWVKSNIKNVTVPKKTSYKFLKKAINGADVKKLNEEIKVKYFNKKLLNV